MSSGYPPTNEQVRARIEEMSLLPADAEPWVPFMRDVMRVPMWMLPAVHAAIGQEGWKTAHDPLERLRGAVRRLAIGMGLRNTENPTLAQLLPGGDGEK